MRTGKTRYLRGITSLVEPLEPRRLLTGYVDIRQPDGSHSINNPQVGQVINLQVWEVVTGANATGSDENVVETFGSFISTDVGAGSVRGNLTGTLSSDFNLNDGGSIGTQADLEGNGDLDLGSNNATSPAGYFYAVSDATSSGVLIGQGSAGAGQEFELAQLQFTVTSLTGGPATNIQFMGRPQIQPGFVSAGWVEDGSVLSTADGDSLAPSTNFEIFPEPASIAIAAVGAVLLLRRRRVVQKQSEENAIAVD